MRKKIQGDPQNEEIPYTFWYCEKYQETENKGTQYFANKFLQWLNNTAFLSPHIIIHHAQQIVNVLSFVPFFTTQTQSYWRKISKDSPIHIIPNRASKVSVVTLCNLVVCWFWCWRWYMTIEMLTMVMRNPALFIVVATVGLTQGSHMWTHILSFLVIKKVKENCCLSQKMSLTVASWIILYQHYFLTLALWLYCACTVFRQ